VVRELHRVICGDLQPDLTILLLPDIQASLARARRRNTRQTVAGGSDESRFEAEKDAFFMRVHEKYREIAAREPVRVVVIDGDMTINQVHRQVINTVEARLEAWQALYKTFA
jgi:dTMP kinase